MKATATVSERGQVTIPKALRTKLGIGPGAVLEFDEDRGRLIGRKASPRNPVDEVWGTLDLAEPVDGFVARVRGG
jgi:antitoxin PrlF